MSSSSLLLIQDLVFPDYILKNESDSRDSSFSVKVSINMDPQIMNQNFSKEIVFAAATRLQQVIAVLISSSIELHKIMSSSNQRRQAFSFFIETSPSVVSSSSSSSSIRINFTDWMSVFVPPKILDQQNCSPIQKISVFVKQVDFLMKTPLLTEYLFGKILGETTSTTQTINNLFQKSLQNAKKILSKDENNSSFVHSIKTMLALLIFLVPSTSTHSQINIDNKSLLTSNNVSQKLFSCSSSELSRLFVLYFLQEKSLLIDSEAEIIAKCELPSSLNDDDDDTKAKLMMKSGGRRRQRNDGNCDDATDDESNIYGSSSAAVSYRKRLSLVGLFSLIMKRHEIEPNSSFDGDYSAFFKLSFLSIIFALSKMMMMSSSPNNFENEFVKYFSSSRNKDQNQDDKESFAATQSRSCWWREVKTVEISHSLDLHNISMMKSLNANKKKRSRRQRSSSVDDDYEESEDIGDEDDDESESSDDDDEEEENANAVGFTCKVLSKFVNPKINNKSLFVFPIVLLHISLFVPTPEQVHRYQFGSKHNASSPQFSMALGLSSNNQINKKGILKKNTDTDIMHNEKTSASSVFLVPSTLHNAPLNQNFSRMIRVAVYFFHEGGVCEKTWSNNNNDAENVQEENEENMTAFSSNYAKPIVKFDFYEREVIEILSSSSSSSSLGNNNNNNVVNQGMMKNTNEDNIALSLSTSFIHIVADPFLNYPMMKFIKGKNNNSNQHHREKILGKIGKILATCESRESKQNGKRHHLMQNVIGQRLIQEYQRASFVVGKHDTSNTQRNSNANFLNSFYSFNRKMSSFLPSGLDDDDDDDEHGEAVTTCASLSKSILNTIPPKSASTRDETKTKFLKWGKERVLFLLRRCVAYLSQRQQQSEATKDQNIDEAVERMKERIDELLEEN